MIKVIAAALATAAVLPLLIILLVTAGPAPAPAKASDPTGLSGAATAAAKANIPPQYLIWYMDAAQTCPGLPWSVLAGIGTVESDNGQSDLPGVHSGANFAGAEGPMQFEPSTFALYATGPDRPLSPYDPADAIYTAGAMLCASGARGGTDTGIKNAVFAYNHADWYVSEVMSWAAKYAAQGGRNAVAAAIAFAKAAYVAAGSHVARTTYGGQVSQAPQTGPLDLSVIAATHPADLATTPRPPVAARKASP